MRSRRRITFDPALALADGATLDRIAVKLRLSRAQVETAMRRGMNRLFRNPVLRELAPQGGATQRYSTPEHVSQAHAEDDDDEQAVDTYVRAPSVLEMLRDPNVSDDQLCAAVFALYTRCSRRGSGEGNGAP